MERVLIVSDFFIGGGLETRILEQVKSYQRHGVECYLVVDEYDKKLVEEFDEVLKLPLRAHDQRTIIESVDIMVKFCQKKGIGMIDVQPLYGMIVASFASAILQIPMSYTLHGRYSIPPADDLLLNWFNIALELRKPQIVLVAEYLKNYYSELLNGKDIRIVRNGVTIPAKSIKKASGGKWIFASRLSGEKSKLLIEAIPILEEASIMQLDIFGGGEDEDYVLDFIDSFNTDATHKMVVNFCGWCNSVKNEILNGAYEGGIGMDRVAVEMLSTGLPVVILGYEGLTHVISEKNFYSFMMNNFTSWEKISRAEILKNFEKIQKNAGAYDVRKIIDEKLNSEKIWTERLREIQGMKTDPGRDAMLTTTWNDFYENYGKTQEIERLRGQLEKTLSRRVRRMLPW